MRKKGRMHCIIEQEMSAYPSGWLNEKQEMQKLEKRRRRRRRRNRGNERMKMNFSNYCVICTSIIFMQHVGQLYLSESSNFISNKFVGVYYLYLFMLMKMSYRSLSRRGTKSFNLDLNTTLAYEYKYCSRI